MIIGLMVGLIGGLIYGLIFIPILWLTNGRDSIQGGLIGMLMIGLVFSLRDGIKSSDIEYKMTFIQKVKQSIKNIIIFTSVTFPPCFGLYYLPKLVNGRSVDIINALALSFLLSLLFSTVWGRRGSRSGTFIIKHFSLRLVLWFNHYIPWNYARFLDYSTDRLFLQRVGGGYRFVHDLLRQHFAEKY